MGIPGIIICGGGICIIGAGIPGIDGGITPIGGGGAWPLNSAKFLGTAFRSPCLDADAANWRSRKKMHGGTREEN